MIKCSPWERGGISWGKRMNVWETQRLRSPRISHIHGSSHSAFSNSSKLSLKCSDPFMVPVMSAAGMQILAVSLWMSLYFQIFRMMICLVTSSLMDARKLIDFQIIQVFLIRQDWWLPNSLCVRAKPDILEHALWTHINRVWVLLLPFSSYATLGKLPTLF